ncbi:MAG: hypothetical protein QGH73_03405 [Rhodospirillales bacterium]|jgi:predicted nucleic acid-binding protein|nr:hypothetical protein [Rhodospirillaceae bacterium]MDP6428292.1 hypothetical protein [Rhodospirillales bacterium]MDP6646157.1 hypothetical protein [Rhodospirillales bacterium]MDP6840706.1 hypothetical protein [Rhodospirillales bacterium]|tara:strand:+ start:1632 stop:1916 length:285 start_codon:yes stop_codon:yes gene_type:complete
MADKSKASDFKRRRERNAKLRENRDLLDHEAEDRSRRIKIRRQQRLKKEAAARIQKRKRMFKVAIVWVGLIFLGFLAATWFSADFVHWMDSFLN